MSSASSTSGFILAKATETTVGALLLLLTIPTIFIIGMGILHLLLSMCACCCNRFDENDAEEDIKIESCQIYAIIVVTILSAIGVICCIVAASVVQSNFEKSLQCDTRKTTYVEKYNLEVDEQRGQTAFMIASAGGYIDAIQGLCGTDASAVDNDGKNALMYATEHGQYEAVSILTNPPFAIDINVRDKQGRTAIIWASINANLNIIRALRVKGANISILDQEGHSVLWYVGEAISLNYASRTKYSSIIAELSVDNSIDLSEALIATAAAGLVNEFTNSIVRGANINYFSKQFHWRASTKASIHGQSGILQIICNNGGNLIDGTNSLIANKLLDLYTNPKNLYADSRNYQPIQPSQIDEITKAMALEELGLTPLYTDSTPNDLIITLSPLIMASLYQQDTSIVALCTCGVAKPSVFPSATEIQKTTTTRKWNALIVASVRGCDTCISPLINICGANPNFQDNDGNTPLYLAALENKLKVITELCQYGANANYQFANTETILTRLSTNQELHYNAISYLLSNPCYANVNLKQVVDSKTALMKAVINYQPEIIKLFMQHGANINDIDSNGHTALHLLALIPSSSSANVLSTMKILCTFHPNPDTHNNAGLVPLMSVVERGDTEMVDVLIQNCDADMNIKEQSILQDTALMKAVRRTSNKNDKYGVNSIYSMCSKASESRLAVSSYICNNDGYTAFTLASVVSNDPNVINALLDVCKVNFNTRDCSTYQDTALTKASRINNYEIVNRLCSFSAVRDVATSTFTAQGINALMVASIEGKPAIIKALVTICKIDIDGVDNLAVSRETALIKAIRAFQDFSIQQLLVLGANSKKPDIYTQTPLLVAAKIGNLMAVQYLCESKNNPFLACGKQICTTKIYYKTIRKCKWCLSDTDHSNCRDCTPEDYPINGKNISCYSDAQQTLALVQSYICYDTNDKNTPNCVNLRNYINQQRSSWYCEGEICKDSVEDYCFSLNSKVRIQVRSNNALNNDNFHNYKEILLSELQYGDKVQSVDYRTGNVIWSTYYINTHFNSYKPTLFLIIETIIGPTYWRYMENVDIIETSKRVLNANTIRKLTITPGHGLPVSIGGCPMNKDSINIGNNALPAEKVRIGDGIWVTYYNTTTNEDQIVCSVVTNISQTILNGHSSPYTFAGTIIVDGIVASTYANVAVHNKQSEYELDYIDDIESESKLYALGLMDAHYNKWFVREIWKWGSTIPNTWIRDKLTHKIILYLIIYDDSINHGIIVFTIIGGLLSLVTYYRKLTKNP